MYDNYEQSLFFSKLEENENYYRVSKIFDLLLYEELMKNKQINQLKVVNLWSWSHIETFELSYKALEEQDILFEWIDNSEHMIKIAKEVYWKRSQNHLNQTQLINSDIFDYLKINKEKVTLWVCKYVMWWIQDFKWFLEALYQSMQKWWVCFVDVPKDSWVLKSHSINARNYLNWESFPLGETKELHEWDIILTKFYNISWDPYSGHTDWIEQIRYYRSNEAMLEKSKEIWFKAQIVDWKLLCSDIHELPSDFNFNILRLEK